MADKELTDLGSVLKQTYENEPNTNALTDAEKQKIFDVSRDTDDVDKNGSKLSYFGVKTYFEEVAANGDFQGTPDIDYNHGNVHDLTITGDVTTFTISNAPLSGVLGSLTLFIAQDATGNHNITWPATIKWLGGTAPTLTQASNSIDIVSLVTKDGGLTWFGNVGQGYA